MSLGASALRLVEQGSEHQGRRSHHQRLRHADVISVILTNPIITRIKGWGTLSIQYTVASKVVVLYSQQASAHKTPARNFLPNSTLTSIVMILILPKFHLPIVWYHSLIALFSSFQRAQQCKNVGWWSSYSEERLMGVSIRPGWLNNGLNVSVTCSHTKDEPKIHGFRSSLSKVNFLWSLVTILLQD